MIYEHRRSPSHYYNTSPYAIPVSGTVSFQAAPIDVNWYSTWPKLKSIFLAIVIIICSATIIGLDIANIAIERNKQNGTSKLGSDTGKVGAGIWCGFISFLAAIFIIVIAFTRNKRIAATFALLAVTLAFFFVIVLIGLMGNSIQNYLYSNNRTDTDKIQNRLVIAIFSIAIVLMIFDIIFFVMFIRIFFSSSTRLSTQR